MKLNYIEVENVRSYLKQKIDFPESTILLAGDIGAGKSTVLLAIEFALFGILRGEVNGTDILRHGKDKGYVRLSFSVNNSNITIHRNLKRNATGVVQDAGWIEVDGHKMNKTPQEMRAFILEKLGYPQEYLTKNPIMYRYTVYTPQDCMKNIILEKSDSRLSILRRLFGVEKYSTIKNNAQIIITEFRAMKRESLALSSGLEEKLSLKEKSKEEKTAAEQKLVSVQSTFEECEDRVVECENNLEKIQSYIKELSEIARKAAYIEAQIQDRKRRNERIVLEIKDISKSQDSIKDIIEPKRPEKTEPQITDGKRKENEKIRQCISVISVLENESRKLRAIVDKGLCEFCGQKVADKNHFAGEINRLEGDKQNQQKEMEASKIHLQYLEKEERELLIYKQEKLLYERKLQEKNEKQKKLAEIESELQANVEFIENTSRNLDELKKSLKDSAHFQEEEAKIKLLLRELQNNRVKASSELSSLKSFILSVERNIKSYENEIKEKELAAQRARKLTETTSWLETVFVPMMEKMEQAVMRTIQQEFNSRFQEWFSVMVNDDNMSISVDREFSPIIEQQGYTTEYQNLSGGEKTAVALAYRLALNKVINDLVDTIKTKDLIILDEPTDGFSYEQIDRIRDVLKKLNLRQMIVVSHEPKIDTFVNNIIKFYKEGHVSRIVA